MNDRPTPEELKRILAEHHAWCRNQGGKQASLTEANLTGANLRGAYLTGADLTECDLTGADLRGAYLTGANLTGANLRGAYLTECDLTECDLTGCDLTGCNLIEVTGIRVASVHWTGHGERGRMVNAVELPSGIQFYCGCFSGNEKELREYITNGDPNLIGSRTRTLDFLLGCF